ncbi:dihydrolipoamide acetyltransferase family protein [Lacisediminihabitans profunda]|uniref:Dihydrolipoamide acetyltransferase component of pyruvate dehydrogenase complex n=1 Tax=Lacisediminihabitans profunda TaxID=2594790 RepID=A0A5C8UM53_9MICO|nr:dihydrolipoamide acetyltransferase family protein [Lacisediminihabitans profunda]TXN29385.1 2-oxo acid dehydrogenase subunit E2 [Lacisediminihabitans profunda]
MATVVRMPEVLAGSAEAAIQTWLIAVGQEVAVGMPLAEVETEKAIVEYAAEMAGTVLQLLVPEGVSVKVGDPIAVLGEKGEIVEVPGPESVAGGAAPAPAPTTTAPTAAEPVPSAARAFISPLVRRLAKERSLDLSAVTGTGPGGRIVRRDIEGMTASAAPAAEQVSAVSAPRTTEATLESPTVVPPVAVPHTAMRRAIARRLTESKSTVPHFYLVADCRVDRLVALRREVNETATTKVSINDFVIKAAAAAFIDVPEANATWDESAIMRYSTVDMSVAVAIDGGLVTPVLRSVERMTLSTVARTVVDLAERARSGRLRQHELEGGSFAVSNLGMYGVTEFSAIINPPQSAILAVGLARQEAVVVDGQIEVGTIMTVTLSADHRVLDGALAARWLAAFVRHVENPLGMLV